MVGVEVARVDWLIHAGRQADGALVWLEWVGAELAFVQLSTGVLHSEGEGIKNR